MIFDILEHGLDIRNFRVGGTEKFGLKGTFEATLFDEFGNIKDYRKIDNLVTNAGFNAACQIIGNATGQSGGFSYSGIGSGVTAANAADTALGSEAYRTAGTFAHTVGTKNFTNTATFGAGSATGSITEAGLLNAASTGMLLNRQTFGVINKGASDSLQIVWTGSLS